MDFHRNGRHHWKRGLYTDEFDARQAEIEILRAVKQRKEEQNVLEFVESLAERKIERRGIALDSAWDVYHKQPGRQKLDTLTQTWHSRM